MQRNARRQRQHRVAGQQSGGVQFLTIEQRQHGHKRMAAQHIGNVDAFAGVDGVEEDDAPEGVQQNHAQRLGGAREEKDLGATVESHRGWAGLRGRRSVSYLYQVRYIV